MRTILLAALFLLPLSSFAQDAEEHPIARAVAAKLTKPGQRFTMIAKLTVKEGEAEKFIAAFAEAVDDYLKTCKKLKQAPNRPYSGQFRLRLDPGLHARAAMVAETRGKSLNAWVSDVIEKSIAS